jgi:hypothetical protein
MSPNKEDYMIQKQLCPHILSRAAGWDDSRHRGGGTDLS